MRRVALSDTRASVLIGRNPESTIRIVDDLSVSRPHAEITHVPGAWMLEDVGSRGGTSIVRDGVARKVSGRERLRHGDRIKVGRTVLRFLDPPADPGGIETALDGSESIDLTAKEREILGLLCAPELEGRGGWPSNAELADVLFVSQATVKTHMSNLIAKFDLQDVPDRQKRARLVRRSIDEGWVTPLREG